ncbi:MAG: PQQ-dependent sugar dehydrogenase, partial [Bacteroidota bacterium]
MIRFLPSPLRGLKLLFVLGIGLFALSFNPSPFGRDEPVAIGPYLSYQLPSVSPLVDWEVQTAFSGLSFDNPAFMIPDHMGETFFIGDREGKVYTIDNELSANEKQLVLDIENITAPVNDGGLLSMALHPEFGQQGSDKSRYVYLYYMGREPGAFVTGEFEGVGFPGLFHNAWMRLSRFTVKENSLEIDPDSELRMINIRMYNGSHRGGELLFGNDGYLYLSLGEQFRYQTAQDLSETLEGGILRIDVDMMPGRSHPPIRRFPLANTPDDEYTGIGYYIPNDNPFLSPDSELFEEYYTLGNRNPYRMAIDRETGQIWMGEVGDSKREEINRVVAGANYGWPYLEGTLVKNQLPDEYYGTLRGPDHEFSRAQAFAIIGGFVYRGSLYPELYGKYICGDFVKSSLWALEIDEEYQIIDEQFLCSFGPGNLVSFGQDPKGEIYLLRANNKFDFASSIYRLAPRTGVPDAPQWLSEVGVFKQLNPLKPEDFLLPYQPIEPFWSDGALKQRWMAIP